MVQSFYRPLLARFLIGLIGGSLLAAPSLPPPSIQPVDQAASQPPAGPRAEDADALARKAAACPCGGPKGKPFGEPRQPRAIVAPGPTD